MRKHTLSAFILIGLMFATAFAAHAQTVRSAVFNVPFDFVIGKRTLPAGKYTVKRFVRDNDSLLLVTSADGRAVESFQTSAIQAAQAKDTAQLEFRRSGATYFL